jgi:hypothetical protein
MTRKYVRFYSKKKRKRKGIKETFEGGMLAKKKQKKGKKKEKEKR